MLLTFSVRDFRCFADEANLSMVSPRLRTNVPRAGQDWTGCTERVAAIYGPNASGKSTLLDAIHALALALRMPGHGAIYQPTLLRDDAAPTTDYDVEFVVQGVRYGYSVRAAPWGIAEETLTSYPRGSQRLLFSRAQASAEEPMTFRRGSSLSGPTAEVRRITTTPMLFLAVAHRYGHKSLAPITRGLLDDMGITHISFRDRQDEQVLRRVVMEMVASPEDQTDLVQALLRAADLGIEDLEVRSERVPDQVLTKIRSILRALDEGGDISADAIPDLQEVVVFKHRGENGKVFELDVQRQSSGTITWLTTAWHTLDALRRGTVLLIDELDASLHPDLARYLVELFLDPRLNHHGAQLVFTTHDASLLGNAPTKLLEPRNVWFVDKDETGHSELFSLDDFDNRSGNNSERRYLAGQFGAVPDIDASLLPPFIAAAGNPAHR